MNASEVPGYAEAPAAVLLRIFDQELDTAVTAERRGQKIYRSLQQLSQLIGGEYGDRVLYELIQNAHDASPEGNPGDIAIHLAVDAEDHGVLYVANGGAGFTFPNVQAIRNIANSTKEVGEGIGNKGVGFRSVEALTTDPHIYSRLSLEPSNRYDGFCFRFAGPDEIEARLQELGHADVASAVAASMPQYLAAIPVDHQPEPVLEFARQGYSTVVVLPLRTASAVKLARDQVDELIRSEAPVLLFLERVRQLAIEVEDVGGSKRRRTLTREVKTIVDAVPDLPCCGIQEVTLGPGRKRWLLVRRVIAPDRVLAAVRRSIEKEPALRRWLEWKGNAVVSVATPLDGRGLKRGRLYNFLPMGPESASPLFAHLDGPFFTTIDRRRAKLDLPLNAELLDAACEACAAAALLLTDSEDAYRPRVIVDLVAWSATQRTRVTNAFQAIGTAFDCAEVWPTTTHGWANLHYIRAWPEGKFKVLSATRIAVAAGASILPPALDADRVETIRALARAVGFSIEPSDRDFAAWAEALAERLPTNADAIRKHWAELYGELAVLLNSTERLRALSGRRIMLDRNGGLLPAGSDVYVRQDGSKRGRAGGAPLPPKEVSRKLSILSADVAVRPETFAAFERAGLWKRYDATQILARLPTLFGERAAPARRQAALLWSFEVWKHDTAAAKKALKLAQLHVPTRDGWIKCAHAAFSGSWTSTGKHLDAYLAEAKALSPVCDRAAARLLINWDEWPGSKASSKNEWLRFLIDAGVVDGLIATQSAVPRGPHRGHSWHHALATASGTGLDRNWHTYNNFSGVYHPYTEYSIRGAAWWLPGQTLVARMSSDGRKRFAILALQHLQQFGEAHLDFKLGRFDRDERHHDQQAIRTPLCTFLMSAAWFPVQRRGEEEFVRVCDAWLHTDRRSDPKFVARAPDEIAEFLSPDGKALEILSQPYFGLRVWKDQNTASARLAALAEVCTDVQQHERAPFRKQYDLAWQDLTETRGELDPGTMLVIDSSGGFSALAGGDPPPTVFVRSGRDRELAKLLVDTGARVLATGGEADADEVIAALRRTAQFDPRLVDDGDVQLLVDGAPFRLRPEDPSLTDVISWLGDALVLGHEIGARDFEKSLQAASLEERLQRVRVRICKTIELQPADGAARRLPRYIYRDDERATLIVVGQMDAEQLSDAAAQLSSLLHPNLRSFEPLLLRLAGRLPQGCALSAVEPPSETDYAFAIQADVEVVREHLAFRSSDHSRKLSLVTPVVAYFAGTAVAVDLHSRLADEPLQRWSRFLEEHLPSEVLELFVDLLDRTEDLALVRRELGLDYATFNRTLTELGRAPLSNEAELRRLFDVWKEDLRPTLRDRVRRHFVGAAGNSVALREYAVRRTLDFLVFDEQWIEAKESLDREDVQRYADRVFDVQFGPDAGGSLPEYEGLRAANRKALAEYVQTALPIVNAAAGGDVPAPWLVGPSEVAAAADRAGALDFVRLNADDMIDALVRADLWPPRMPRTLDLGALGLTQADLDAEAKKIAEQRAEEVRKRSRIDFAGRSFDSSALDFASDFAAFAEDLFAKADWRARSKLRPANLQPLPEGDTSHRGGSGKSGKARVLSKLPEAIRSGIGLAGELLAFHYLRAKHRDRFTESCWVSENRRSLFPEEGDPRLGFDFRVNTSETEWLYEVKATLGDACEFELTDNEYRKAVAAGPDKGRKYRILLVQHILDLDRCRVLELPNPATEAFRSHFQIIGRGSVRMKFQLA